MPPSSTICAWLAALARQPTMAMNSGISGAATTRISATTQLWLATASAITSGTVRTRHMAVW